MDGSFNFKRFKNHAGTIVDPLMKNYFIDINEQNSSENDEIEPSNDCNNFRSGDERRKQAQYCDISGIFGSVCSHGFVYGLMNIAKGESLAYSCAMVKMIKNQIADRRFVVSYDIICKLINHVKNLVDIAFVPEMHAYSHNGVCQSKYNPKNILGIGFEEGEDCERTWAHFIQIAAISTVMRNENREDFLSFAVEAFNHLKLMNLANSLNSDLKRCAKEIETILSRTPLSSMPSYTALWQKNSEERCRLSSKTHRPSSLTRREQVLKELEPNLIKYKSVKLKTQSRGKSLFILFIFLCNLIFYICI